VRGRARRRRRRSELEHACLHRQKCIETQTTQTGRQTDRQTTQPHTQHTCKRPRETGPESGAGRPLDSGTDHIPEVAHIAQPKLCSRALCVLAESFAPPVHVCIRTCQQLGNTRGQGRDGRERAGLGRCSMAPREPEGISLIHLTLCVCVKKNECVCQAVQCLTWRGRSFY
jgi:hypothetical protein